MKKDILFLLAPNFRDGNEGPFFCPECAEVRGLLAFYPQLEDKVDIRYVNFQRPRPEVIQFTGEAEQSCPALILSEPERTPTDGIEVMEHGGNRFISGSREIAGYFARAYQTGRPH
jgi:hypothetical protein